MADINEIKEKWKSEQIELQKKIHLSDTFSFDIGKGPQYVGGVDISFVKNDPVNAVAGLVVLRYPDLKVVYEQFEHIELHLPYIAGFLAWREQAPLSKLLTELKASSPNLFPQLLFVDGCGVLHPRKFGLACHLGLTFNIPVVGVCKNFLVVDGLTMDGVKAKAKQLLAKKGDSFPLLGDSGYCYGSALRTGDNAPNPVFVSPGHNISHDSAVKFTLLCSPKFRIPEPIRQADLRSRAKVREIAEPLP